MSSVIFFGQAMSEEVGKLRVFWPVRHFLSGERRVVEGIESSYAGRPPAFCGQFGAQKVGGAKKRAGGTICQGQRDEWGGGEGADNHRQDECVT